MSKLDELLASIPTDAQTYVGEVLKEPLFSTLVRPSYHVNVRSLKGDGRTVKQGAAELILTDGKRLPVTVIGFGTVHPTREAVQSGAWTANDETIFLDSAGLTNDQVKLARGFLQRQA